MAQITTRQTAGVGATVAGVPLTNAQLDQNFINLNTDKLELGGTYSSGTASGVTYLNGSKVLTTGSALTFDGQYVSIGAGASSPNGIKFLANGGGLAANLTVNHSSGEIQNFATTNYFQTWYANNAEQMRLTFSGNLGIGTSSPGYKLDVQDSNPNIAQFTSSGSSTSLRINNTNANAWGSNIGIFTGGTAAGYFGTIGSLLGNTTQDLAVYATAGNGFRVYTNGNNLRATLDSSGNLGIGTSSPVNKLVVSNAGAAGFEFDPANGIMQTYNRSGAAYTAAKVYGLTFEVRTGASPAANTFFIDSSGNLGLGVTPSAWSTNYKTLQSGNGSAFVGFVGNDQTFVVSNAYNDGSWKYKNTAGAGYYSISGVSSGAHSWFTAPSGTANNAISFTQAMTLDASGRLLVGVTSASGNAALQVKGATSGYARLEGTSSTLFAGDASLLIIGGGATESAVRAEGALLFASGGATERARISSDGTFRVKGAGTAGSTDAVQFSGSAPASAMTLDASGRLLVGATSASSGARATLTSAAQSSGAACADSGILLYPTASLATGEYAPFITWSGNSTNPNRARAAIGAVSSGTSTALDLVFLTRSAADASEIGTGSERARITSGGYFKASNAGTYQNAAAAYHELRQTASDWIGYFVNTNATPYGIQFGHITDANSTGSPFFQCTAGAALGTLRAEIRSNGGLANYSANNVNLSDRREKTNFAPAKSYLDTICAIPVQTFNYIDQSEDDPGLTLGVVAQDVQAVAPELVMESNWGTEDNPKMRLSIYQTDLQYALMKCVQELKSELDSVKAELATLKGQP